MKLKNSSFFLLDGFVLILFLLMNIPQLQLLSLYNYLCLGVTLVILFIIVLNKGALKFRKKPAIILFATYTVLTTLIPLFFGRAQIFNRYLTLSEGFIFYIIYEYNKHNRDNNVNIRLIFLFVVLQLYTIFSTLYALSEDGHACRSIKSTFIPGDNTYMLLLSGVSGYDLIYSSLIECVVLFCLFIFGYSYLKKKYRCLTVVFILLFSVLIVMSNYFTATILLFGGFVFAIIAQRGAKILILIIPLLFIYGLAHKTINEAAFNIVLSVIPEGRTHDRIAIIQLNTASSESEELDSREETTAKSENLIIEYPLLGYITSEDYVLENVGQHSYLLDTMALYGIFIGLLGCYSILLPFILFFRKTNNTQLRRVCLLIGSLYLLLLYRNNLTLDISYSAYFYFPTLFSFLKDKISTAVYDKRTVCCQF